MKSEKFVLIVICLVGFGQFCPASGDSEGYVALEDSGLKVHLLREIVIKDNLMKLGDVSVVYGREDLANKAREVNLGRISLPGQRVVIDRSTILSRLACSEISLSEVTLSGAEQVTVRKQQRTIRGDEFVELAKAFFMENPPVRSVCQLNPVSMPKDMPLPASDQDLQFSRHFVNSGARNQTRIRIVVYANGKQVGMREVRLLLKYECHNVLTQKEISAGEAISPDNVRIEKVVSDNPDPSNWKPPYGLIVKHNLTANTVVRSDMLGPVTPAIAIKRNGTVVIRIERPGLLVTAIGRALQQGCSGEFIKICNVDSQRTILCRVNEDGTVEPVL